jgi:hypothetical protein
MGPAVESSVPPWTRDKNIRLKVGGFERPQCRLRDYHLAFRDGNPTTPPLYNLDSKAAQPERANRARII